MGWDGAAFGTAFVRSVFMHDRNAIERGLASGVGELIQAFARAGGAARPQ
jgi:hypothetical protein